MVNAILNDTKTQTRRIVKGRKQPWDGKDSLQECKTVERDGTGHGFVFWKNGLGGAEFTKQQYPTGGWQCPYGKPGDRLWVRETWTPGTQGTVIYRAAYSNGHEFKGWKPSIHMPRWASRITLEVVSVRVERLQDISEEDAWAEGIPKEFCEPGKSCTCESNPVGKYADLWESINGPGSWDANPYVWVVEFRKLDQP